LTKLRGTHLAESTEHSCEVLLGLESTCNGYIEDACVFFYQQLLSSLHPCPQNKLVRSNSRRLTEHLREVCRAQPSVWSVIRPDSLRVRKINIYKASARVADLAARSARNQTQPPHMLAFGKCNLACKYRIQNLGDNHIRARIGAGKLSCVARFLITHTKVRRNEGKNRGTTSGAIASPRFWRSIADKDLPIDIRCS